MTATNKIDPARCPIRDIHERAIQPGNACSQCGWRPLPDVVVGPRKTFFEGAWRVLEMDGGISAKCNPPTADERARWAEEDKQGVLFPPISEAPPPGTRVYKVVTQRDEWFGGQFDPAKLTQRINELALDGWRVVAITAADVSTFFGTFWSGRGARQELVAFLEKEV